MCARQKPVSRVIGTSPHNRDNGHAHHNLLYKVETLKIIIIGRKKNIRKRAHRTPINIHYFYKEVEKKTTLGPIRLHCVCIQWLLLLQLTFLWMHAGYMPSLRHRHCRAAGNGGVSQQLRRKMMVGATITGSPRSPILLLPSLPEYKYFGVI